MKSTILIVDDTRLIVESLKKALSREGYEILTAGTGREALLSYEENSPDLILLDVKLPDTDGIQVLQQIPKTASEKPLERFLVEALASNPEAVHQEVR